MMKFIVIIYDVLLYVASFCVIFVIFVIFYVAFLNQKQQHRRQRQCRAEGGTEYMNQLKSKLLG